MNSLANEGLEVLKKNNLTKTDFKFKQNSFINVFKKVLDKNYKWDARLLKSVDNIDEWYTKGDDQEIINRIKTAYPELNAIIKKLIECKSTEGAYSYSAQAAYNYIYQLGILGEILHQIRLYRDKHDVILIPDTTHLIHKIKDQYRENQKIQRTATFSRPNTKLALIRENVINSLRNRVHHLVLNYKATPIYEFEISNFETGSGKITKIYDSVKRSDPNNSQKVEES